MKKGWQIKTLGEICEIERGGSPRPIQNFVTTDPKGINWIKIGDATASGKYIYKTEEKIKPEGVKRSRMVYEGDFILSNSMSFGRPYIMKTTGCIHDGWLVLHQPKVDPDYLYHVLSSDLVFSQFDRLAAGSTVRNLNIGLAKSVEIPYPPLPEQQRIVGILDEAFDGIATAKANAERSLQNARALFESHLQSVFTNRGKGWVVKRISEIAKHSLGKMLDKAKNKGELQPYLRNINVRWLTFDLSDLLQMPFLPQETAKYTAIKGDVLICEGGYPGRAAIWNGDYPIYFQKALHRVRFQEPEHNKWFVYYLFAQDRNGELKQHFSGTGIQHFTGEVLARFELPLPPLSELRRAVARFEELSVETQRLEAIYQQKLAALDKLKKSLLHQALAENFSP
jgi:type I restriction enzyme S subunit